MGNNASHPQLLLGAIQSDAGSTVLSAVSRNPKLFALKLDAETGNHLLHAAVQARAHNVLRLLLTAQLPEGAPRVAAAAKHVVNKARGSDGLTPLMLAAQLGDAESVELLMQGGADPWVHEMHQRTAIHLAALSDQAAAIRALVRNAQPPLPHPPAPPPPPAAPAASPFARPSMELVTSAVKQVVTHVHHAVDQVVDYIISPEHERRLVDAPSRHNITPLMLAASNNSAEAARELLQLGAAFKPRCWWNGGFPNGSSALHIAALNGCREAAWAIVDDYAISLTPEQQSAPSQLQRNQVDGRPIDPRLLQDQAGRTPFALARSLRHFSLVHLLNPVTPLSLVLDAESPERRAVGAPRLMQIAGQVAQGVLLGQVHALRSSIRDAREKQQQQQQQEAEALPAARGPAAGPTAPAPAAAAGTAPGPSATAGPSPRPRLGRLQSLREEGPGSGLDRLQSVGLQSPGGGEAVTAAGAAAAASEVDLAALYHRLYHGVSSPSLTLDLDDISRHALPDREELRTSQSAASALPDRAELHGCQSAAPVLSGRAAGLGALREVPEQEGEGGPDLLGLGATAVAHDLLAAGADMALGVLTTAAGPLHAEPSQAPWVCEVCADSDECVAIQPCAHWICVSCAEELIKLHGLEVLPCPFCRGGIKGFVQP